MGTNVDEIFEEALRLSDESKAILAERIVEYLVKNVASNLEGMHLTIVNRRRDEINRGQVKAIDGQEALAKALEILNR